jgi:glycerol-3-phosphate dehydrogenase
MEDVIIIGAGILGTTIARLLSRYNLNITVLEKAYDLGEGATKSNSAVLAAGYHARGGSLKGISGARGNRMYQQICADLGVKVSYPGSLHCAFSEEGIEELEKKKKKGEKNGAEGLLMISGDEARAMQPGLSRDVTGALYAPTTGIIDVFQLLVRTAQAAYINGVTFHFGEEVTGIEEQEDGYIVHTDQQVYSTRYLVNTGGENAALLESMVRPQELEIKPRRGQFMVFDKKEGAKMKYVLYQQQETDEKGCLLAPTVDGNIIAGPTSENVDSYRRTETTAWGINHISKVARKVLPDIDLNAAIVSFAGIRANITNVEKEQKDFVVRISAPHMVSALGIKNPGVTGAPYLMQLAVDQLVEEGLVLEEKEHYQQQLHFAPRFLDATEEQQKEMLERDASYGRVVCRCEKITEGDIRAVLQEPLPPKSMNGLKKRLRVGMGRCQGGFCTPRVIELLAAEWKVPPEKIVKSSKGSELVKGRVK